jgi:predicted membrane protein
MKSNQEKTLEASMAMVLLTLIIYFFNRHDFLLLIAFAILVCAMTFPKIMEKPSQLWYGIAKFLGFLSNILINSFVFIFILLPISLSRKVMRSHTDLNVKSWKSSKESSFITRNKTVVKEDLENLF